jgi:hypothetical protein
LKVEAGGSIVSGAVVGSITPTKKGASFSRPFTKLASPAVFLWPAILDLITLGACH